MKVNGDAGDTTAWYNDSDRNLKKNIDTIENALHKVRKLHGVEFEWIDTENHPEGKQIGFIGQEATDVVPEVVDVKDGTYSMQYAPLTALLVEAVKALKAEKDAEIAELKGRLSQMNLLRKENAELRERLTALESMVAKASQLQKGGL